MKSIILIISLSTLLIQSSFAQKAKGCDSYMTSEYISDGQYYSTPITYGETREFKTTFIAGNIYRIAACSSFEKNVNFYIYDQDNNLLFTNTDYQHAPYWDFEFPNTMQCTIKVSLVSEQVVNDFASISIGFKQ